jgi:hypothetical protein
MPRCLDLLTRSCLVLGMLKGLAAQALSEDRFPTIPEAVWANFDLRGNERLVPCSSSLGIRAAISPEISAAVPGPDTIDGVFRSDDQRVWVRARGRGIMS